MLIAKELRKKNIIEYLLYMWQIEDLMRAFNLNMDMVEEKIIKPYQLPEKETQTLFDWYESIIEMMRSENVQQSGHIQLNKNIIIQLDDFHKELMKSGKQPDYNAKFYHILPYLTTLRSQQTDKEISDIELCFNFLYGIIVLNMRKQPVTEETQKASEEVKKFMSLLNNNYFKHENGELELTD